MGSQTYSNLVITIIHKITQISCVIHVYIEIIPEKYKGYCVSSTLCHEWYSNSLTLVEIDTYYIGSCKFDYHTITTMTAPTRGGYLMRYIVNELYHYFFLWIHNDSFTFFKVGVFEESVFYEKA
jgi:hypothetical protein